MTNIPSLKCHCEPFFCLRAILNHRCVSEPSTVREAGEVKVRRGREKGGRFSQVIARFALRVGSSWSRSSTFNFQHTFTHLEACVSWFYLCYLSSGTAGHVWFMADTNTSGYTAHTNDSYSTGRTSQRSSTTHYINQTCYISEMNKMSLISSPVTWIQVYSDQPQHENHWQMKSSWLQYNVLVENAGSWRSCRCSLT